MIAPLLTMKFWVPLILAIAPCLAVAEENVAVNPGSGVTNAPTPALPRKARKNRSTRNKETEGTQAQNRFEPTPVLRSQYQFEGQHLEVDPD